MDESVYGLEATPMWIRINITNPYKSAYKLTTSDKSQIGISKQLLTRLSKQDMMKATDLTIIRFET